MKDNLATNVQISSRHARGAAGSPKPCRPAARAPRAWLVLGCALWSLAAPAAWAWQAAEQPPGEQPPEQTQLAPVRLFEQDPYDEITLDDADKTVIKVLPLDLPERRLPESPKDRDKLIVRKTDEPDQDYELRWGDIAEVKLFEHLVLAEAQSLVKGGRIDEAYDYFDFLKRRYPNMDALAAALEDYLFEDAKVWQRTERYENSLALLQEIYQLNPARSGLDIALGAATDKLVERHVAASDFAAARRLLAGLAARFPSSPIIAKWEQSFANMAGELLVRARSQMESGQLDAAQETGRQALAVWPRHPEIRTFLEEAYRRYRRVVVGVTALPSDSSSSRLLDWASRRSGRLLNRYLVEFTGTGPEGGRYQCPFGQIEQVDVGRKLVLRLRPGIAWSNGELLTGYDVARRLISLADPKYPDGQPDWAELFAAVQVQNVHEVGIDLNWTHVRPDALLQAPLEPLPGQAAAGSSLGPFRLLDRTGEQVRYVANEAYFAAESAQPSEIVERYFAESKSSLAALKQGEIQVLDRINPWELDKVAAFEHVKVVPYALPTVHCLLPNLNRPFLNNRAFRRALVYAVNRERILNTRLLSGAQRAGCQVISGPFPIGNGFDDPLRYAYDLELKPYPFEPRLALTLVGVAVHEEAAVAKARGEPEVKQPPALVLAHPPHEIARTACEAIQGYLQAIGLTVTLTELPPGAPLAAHGDYDLIYAELVVQEPLVEARRLLGADGLVGGASPYMSLALRQLDAAAGWNAARAKLRQIHRIAASDVAVVPLWQLTDHFAYHDSLRGVGGRAVLLYQQVEQWQPTFPLVAEVP